MNRNRADAEALRRQQEGREPKSQLEALEKTIMQVPQVVLREPVEEVDEPTARPTPDVSRITPDSRYQLEGEIARGGMGVILRGRDTDLGRDLVFKLLRESRQGDPDVIQRFIEEAQIGGQLQHPGIVPVYELGQFTDGRPYFTMKLVKGKTLSALLSARENWRDDRRKFLDIFKQICQTMAYAHSRGVIHRDLKPSNIMVGAFGEVQVMDWGLAKVLTEGGVVAEESARDSESEYERSVIQTRRSSGSDTPEDSGSQTRMGSVLGTPAYMPPEQALGEVNRMDERVDVFGLGAILCEILTGQPPYVGNERTSLYAQAQRGDLNDCFARLMRCEADDELLEIVKGCLAVAAPERWRNAGVLEARLTSYLQSVEDRLRQAEVGRAEQAARAVEAQRTVEAAEAHSHAERRARRLQLGLSTAIILFATIGILVTSIFLREQRRQTVAVTDALGIKSDYLYVAHMQMAEQAWRGGSVRRVRELLDQHQSQNELNDRRTFAWFYFDHLCRRIETTPSMDFGDYVTALAFSPDGTYVVAAGNDGEIQVFDLPGYRHAARLSGPEQKVRSLQVGSDGRTIVSRDAGGFRVWRRTGDDFESLVRGITSNPFQTQLSSDSRFLLSPSEDAIQIWDLGANEIAKQSVSIRAPVADLRWFGSGHRFVVALAGGIVELRNAEQSQDVKELLTFAGGVKSLALSSDDRYLTLASDESIQTYLISEAMDATLKHDLGRPDDELSYLLSLGSSIAAVTGANLSIWDCESGQLSGRIPEQATSETASFIASSDGNLIAMIGRDSLVPLWDGRSAAPRGTIRGHGNVVYAADFGPEQQICTGGRDKAIRVSPTNNLSSVLELRGHQGRIWSVAFSADGNLLASAGQDSDVILWDPKTGQQLHRFSDHTESVQYVVFSPRQNMLISGSRDDTIKLWSLDDYQLIGECLGHTGDVNSIEFSRDGTRFVSAGDDGAVIVWDLDARQPVARHNVEGARIWAVAYAADGSIAFGGTDHMVHTWNLSEGHAPEQLYAGESNVSSLRFSPDSSTLACTTADGLITLFDYERRVSKSRPTAHASDAMFTDFSPDGRTLVSAGSDGKVQLWFLSVNEPTIQFDVGDSHVHCVSFSPDGSRIASGSWDETVRVWSTH